LSDSEIDRILHALDSSRRSRLRDLTAGPSALQPTNPFAGVGSRGLLGGLFDPPPPSSSNPFESPFVTGGLLGALTTPPPVPAPTNALSRYTSPPVVPYRPAAPVAVPEVKRKVYFAFSFSDVIRVNNVRNTGKIGPRETKKARVFYDRSMWEQRSIANDPGLKTLMRAGVAHSSVICVLVGADTWKSRWVRYEIARAVIDERGLFGIHINSINHNQRRAPDPPGYNPLDAMAVYKDSNGKYYLWEKVVAADVNGVLGWKWEQYDDFTDPIRLPRYMADMDTGYLRALLTVTSLYDFTANDGAKNIGAWIDAAAVKVGR
jgi:hypothetical protein